MSIKNQFSDTFFYRFSSWKWEAVDLCVNFAVAEEIHLENVINDEMNDLGCLAARNVSTFSDARFMPNIYYFSAPPTENLLRSKRRSFGNLEMQSWEANELHPPSMLCRKFRKTKENGGIPALANRNENTTNEIPAFAYRGRWIERRQHLGNMADEMKRATGGDGAVNNMHHNFSDTTILLNAFINIK